MRQTLTSEVKAAAVATPVLARRGAEEYLCGKIVGATATVAYVDLDGFVVILTSPGIPLFPNGIALDRQPSPDEWPLRASHAALAAGGLYTERMAVTWSVDEATSWNPSVSARVDDAAKIGLRGAAILRAFGTHIPRSSDRTDLLHAVTSAGLCVLAEPKPRVAASLLFESLVARDVSMAARATRLLLGFGPGLTPAGDDLVTGVALVVATCGRSSGLTEPVLSAFLRALCPRDLRALTTSLSATLIELAVQGFALEPLGSLLDAASPDDSWLSSLETLRRLGRSTGSTLALGAGVAAFLLCGVAESSRTRGKR